MVGSIGGAVDLMAMAELGFAGIYVREDVGGSGLGRLDAALAGYLSVLGRHPDFHLPWERGEMIAQALEVILLRFLHGEADDSRVKRTAGLKDLERFFRRGRCDDGPTGGAQFDHMVIWKPQQPARRDGSG
jgi:hypothetical protein